MNDPLFIPHRTFGAILRVLNGPGALKHGDEWKTRADHIDMDAALRHELKASDPEYTNIDADTGEPHELLALCRRVIVYERKRLNDERA